LIHTHTNIIKRLRDKTILLPVLFILKKKILIDNPTWKIWLTSVLVDLI